MFGSWDALECGQELATPCVSLASEDDFKRVERDAERILFVVCVMDRKLSQLRSMTRLGLSVNTSNIMLYHAVVAVPNLRLSLRVSRSSTSSR